MLNRSRLRRGLIAAAASACAAAAPALADEAPALPRTVAEAEKMEAADALPRTSFYDAPSLTATRPGALLKHEAFTGYALPKGMSAVRILYHSQDADGRDVATSGVVLLPAGQPPAGGWPVIAWAHGTSGVARQCAPSLEKDLTYGEEGLFPMVRAGFAVVATDYHGLGTEGPHQYVNKIAQARDVIYSVPAARTAVPALGRRWVVDGHSQGGLAAWSVAEMEATLKDPDYLGAVSVAGGGDIDGILRSMADAGSSAAFYLTYMAYAVRARTPEFKPDEMLVGNALKRYPDITTKGCWLYAYASFLDNGTAPVVKPGWDKAPAPQRLFKESEIGLAPIGGPLLVIAGEADETVPLAHVKSTVAKACTRGIALAFRSYPGLDHDPVMAKSTPDQLAWIRDRYAGKPFAGTCAAPAH